jgi:hypothetical protein
MGLHPNVILFRNSQVGSPKIPKIGTPYTLEGHNFLFQPLIEMRFKQSFSPYQEIFNYMWHATCMHVFQGDSRLLMVRNQIGTLTFNTSFGHNLCFKYSNGSRKPILNIYISRNFQRYKEIFNPMNFDPEIPL